MDEIIRGEAVFGVRMRTPYWGGSVMCFSDDYAVFGEMVLDPGDGLNWVLQSDMYGKKHKGIPLCFFSAIMV